MARVPLQLNELIRLKIHGGESVQSFVSRLLEWKDEDLLVTWPSLGGSPIAIQHQQAVRVHFDRSGMAYSFEGMVLEANTSQDPLLTIRPTGPVERIERRTDLRVAVEVAVELNVKVVSLEAFRSAGEGTSHISTRTVTLSGGGFAIRHHEPIPPGKMFEVRMFLEGRPRALIMGARVVRCEAVATAPEEESYEIAFLFTRIAESSRTRIVRFAFKIQKEISARNAPMA